jgi:type II secretory pathway predicted ATPase ExeA
MTALALRTVLDQHGIQLTEVAAHVGISRSAVSLLCNRGQWPARDRSAVRDQIKSFLQSRGIEPTDGLFKKAPARANAPRPGSPATPKPEETADMLLRKHTVAHSVREHFGLSADPFAEPREIEEVFTASADIRYVREAMLDAAMHGGFLAVIGESGAGKSTLREELIDRLQRESRNVIVIQPYVLAMESSETVGKTLRSQHIAEAIMAEVAPLAKTKSSPEARFRQLHQALRESGRNGMRHVLVIEEAHALPRATLRHLKRYLELKDGLRPLVSIILLGQPELATKLAEQDPEVREVVQRIEVVTLAPLDTHLEAYLAKRFERAGVPLARVIDGSGLDALRTRLAPTSKRAMSLLYPLAVHNLLARAMGIAADIGAERVTADIVREV